MLEHTDQLFNRTATPQLIEQPWCENDYKQEFLGRGPFYICSTRYVGLAQPAALYIQSIKTLNQKVQHARSQYSL